MLYRWRSEALRAYGSGHIIVAAKDTGDARQKVREVMDGFVNEKFPWHCPLQDEDDLKDIDKLKSQIEDDIKGDPEIVFSEVLLIEGSE